MFSNWLKILLWIVVIGLLFNMWFGGEVEEEPVIDIDFDKVVNYTAVEEDTEELEREGRILRYSLVFNNKAEVREIKESVKKLVKDLREERQFNALVIELFDHEKYLERTEATLGSVIYAPEGRIDLADTISAGDYRDMEFSWDVLNKDWEQRPEEQEIEIWAKWQDTYDRFQNVERDKTYSPVSWKEAGQVPALYLGREISPQSVDFMIGRKFDLSIAEVAEIRNKNLRWRLLDIQK